MPVLHPSHELPGPGEGHIRKISDHKGVIHVRYMKISSIAQLCLIIIYIYKINNLIRYYYDI